MLYETYLKNSLIPVRYKTDIPLKPSVLDVPVFTELKGIKDNIKSFVDNGENLIICSKNAGNGKTSWACKLLRQYINDVQSVGFVNNTPALFINVNNFMNEKKLAISDQTLAERVNQTEKNILSAKLVVFDDIADKLLSEYEMNLLYYWLDYRTSNLKSCIYTSNQLPDDLKKSLNGKVYSRIVNYSHIKIITDGDHRKA